MSENNYIGRDGFFWFTGVVEDIIDPLGMGRVRVRIHGRHTSNLTEIPTDTLPWSMVGLPTTESGVGGIGRNSGLLNGSWVYGFYIDGCAEKTPFVIGVISGIPQQKANPNIGFNDNRKNTSGYPQNTDPQYSLGAKVVLTNTDKTPYPEVLDVPDVSPEALGVDSVRSNNRQEIYDLLEWETAAHESTGLPTDQSVGGTQKKISDDNYAPKAPFNKTNLSESGHIIELDDTVGVERVNIQHRSGSHLHVNGDGDTSIVSVSDMDVASLNDTKIFSGGDMDVFVGKGGSVRIDGAGESLTLYVRDGRLNITAKVGVNVTTDNFNINAGGSLLEMNSNQIRLKRGGSTVVLTDSGIRSLKGGSRIDISDSGITEIGPKIKLN